MFVKKNLFLVFASCDFQFLVQHVVSLVMVTPVHTTQQKRNKLKSKTFLRSITEVQSQDKPLPRDLVRQEAGAESHWLPEQKLTPESPQGPGGGREPKLQ